MSTHSSLPVYLSAREAAFYADVTPGTIRRWCQTGFLSAQKVAGQWRITMADMIDCMERAYCEPNTMTQNQIDLPVDLHEWLANMPLVIGKGTMSKVVEAFLREAQACYRKYPQFSSQILYVLSVCGPSTSEVLAVNLQIPEDLREWLKSLLIQAEGGSVGDAIVCILGEMMNIIDSQPQILHKIVNELYWGE